MSRDSVRVGEAVKLRAKFSDSDLEPIEATSISVSLYEPGLDPDSDPATVSGLVPTYVGEGVYEVEVTGTAPGGQWIDRWTGTILGTVTTVNLSFAVLDSGVIKEYPTFGLHKNNLVEIILGPELAALSGNLLGTTYTSRFTTQYNPLCSSVRKVRLEAGGLLGGVDDDTINLAILEASLEADVLTFKKSGINRKLYDHAKREYVTCRAAGILASNLMASGGMLKSKLLSDFRVDYDTEAIMELLDRLHGKCQKWAAQVQSGGNARAIRNPRGVVKGELDPDRPAIGRLWMPVTGSEKPMGNTKTKLRGSRRYRTSYRARFKPNSFKDSDW